MRKTNGYGGDRYTTAGRPPLDQLPAELAALLTEHDTAVQRLRDAERERERLAHRDRDLEAQQADAAAAAAAARAGKKIPPAAAVSKLDTDRQEAARAVDAHKAAVKAIRDELDQARDTAAEKARTTATDRSRIDKAAAEFAAVVEQVIADRAAFDWMRGAGYSAAATTWAVDVVPALSNHSMNRQSSPTITARNVITNLVDALLEE